MDDAGLHDGRRKHGGDSLGKSLQAIDDGDQNVLEPRFLSSVMTRNQNLAPFEVSSRRKEPRTSWAFGSLPQYRRARCSGRKSHPRHRRQLRRPQTAQGSQTARRSSALDVPFHVDIGLLAQRRRGLLLRHHAPPDPTRSLPFRRPFAERDRVLHRLPQQRLSTVRIDHFRRRYAFAGH